MRTSFSVVSPTSAVYQVTFILSRQCLAGALAGVQDWATGLSLNADTGFLWQIVYSMMLLHFRVEQNAFVYLESHYGTAALAFQHGVLGISIFAM